MTTNRRKLVLAVVFLGAVMALALTLGRGSSTGSAAKAGLAKKNASAIGRIRESSREAQIADGTTVEPDSAAAEDLAARAYPSNEVTFSERQAAIAAGAKVAKRKAKHQNAWESLGPSTLNVDRLGTQTYQRPTQWSGRETALAVDPKCDAAKCALYLGAAGGGVWRSMDALAQTPTWKFVSGDIPSTAVGSITIDPTDPTGGRSTSAPARRTTAATAPPASASTAAPTTATLVARRCRPADRSAAVRSTTRSRRSRSTRAMPSTSCSGRAAARGARPRTAGPQTAPDGRAAGSSSRTTAARVHRHPLRWERVNEVKFDPTNANVFYAAIAGVGLQRSTRRRPGRRSSPARAAATRLRPRRSGTGTRASTSPTRTAAASRARPTASTTPASPR